jgi:hypothetical protein
MFENRRDPGLSRELVAAWIVTLLVGAFGLIVTSRHAPDVCDRVVAPQWYDPPVTCAEPSDKEASGSRGGAVTTSQADNLPPICDAIAGSASATRAPVPGTAANGCELPC